jgi:hypothetical protein
VAAVWMNAGVRAGLHMHQPTRTSALPGGPGRSRRRPGRARRPAGPPHKARRHPGTAHFVRQIAFDSFGWVLGGTGDVARKRIAGFGLANHDLPFEVSNCLGNERSPRSPPPAVPRTRSVGRTCRPPPRSARRTQRACNAQPVGGDEQPAQRTRHHSSPRAQAAGDRPAPGGPQVRPTRPGGTPATSRPRHCTFRQTNCI